MIITKTPYRISFFGGGSFLLMYMKKKYRENFFKKYPKMINIPFKFSNVGTEVIFKDLNR